MKFRYIVVLEDYSMKGTNDTLDAMEASEFTPVIDCETGKTLEYGGEDKDITEYEP